jgi:hypothetical protein
VASIEADADVGRALIVPARGRRLSAAELNAALKDTPYRVTGLRART